MGLGIRVMPTVATFAALVAIYVGYGLLLHLRSLTFVILALAAPAIISYLVYVKRGWSGLPNLVLVGSSVALLSFAWFRLGSNVTPGKPWMRVRTGIIAVACGWMVLALLEHFQN